ncbi:unnamed protein product [Spirodela intermedia]|uniref:Uncharacterized protein n=1 Tax=Spirodela intermedia TaxID=51605 RepID=A0A7I8IM86_SPIIN|nr:unnamed protein product [Spirodela intermedia]CAA6658640.1 unnamed protein product [Spirodela intermedia]
MLIVAQSIKLIYATGAGVSWPCCTEEP